MNRQKIFTNSLMRWYRKYARDLPWRRTSDPYKIWISEVMLQQTTVNAVIPYYTKWVRRYPTVQRVAKAPLQSILNTWQGLGYYSRARNIQKSAKIITKELNGKIPKDPEILKKLPGFGPYTVGAVLSIAFDIPSPIIDANIRRVVMRQLAKEGHADATQDKDVFKFLENVMPNKGANIFNQALMELGALVCRSKQPLCLLCPVKENCLAYSKGVQDIIPAVKKKTIKDVHVAIALFKKNGSFYIQKRGPKGLFADLWEFPGGKIENGETPKAALRREIREELGVELKSAQKLMDVKQYYTEFRANLSVWLCDPKKSPRQDKTHKWVNRRNLAKYPMPSGSAKIVDKLLSEL